MACSIRNTRTAQIDDFNAVYAVVSNDTFIVPYTAMRTFSQSAGSAVYRLNCTIVVGTKDEAKIEDLTLTAMFFPTRY